MGPVRLWASEAVESVDSFRFSAVESVDVVLFSAVESVDDVHASRDELGPPPEHHEISKRTSLQVLLLDASSIVSL